MYMYIYTRIKRALRARNGSQNYITKIYYGRYSMADVLQQIEILRQIHYGKYMMTDKLRQLNQSRYITADILHGRYITAYIYILGQL